jgi:hypothetical protein
MVKKVTKRMRLDLTGVKPTKRAEVKDKIGNYVVDQIQKHLNMVKSPVSGETFDPLSKDYKAIKKKKGAGSRANLFLEGDMRFNLGYEPYQGGLEIGIFDEGEAQKADNHNKVSAKSKKTGVPKRQFIPNREESFNEKIMNGIQSIIDKASE